ncbi:MAG: mandelate racemase/muconate lactonizing enzyme family protein [Dehalococcoidia bacterium]|nr:mandelate racemase/muconate lactonizing enzyme family protein [Dehalococcoidia bacterium]|tara:strand:+ start:4259 stop:5518 length:1260 start_codon:yes stop_codon:yes gene_type:complete
MIISQIETIRVAQFPDLIFVQVHTDTGLTGLGETWYAAATVESAIHDHFGPLLVGRDPFEIERHWQTMFRLSDHAGYGGAELRAISAIDVALWDIKGQSLNMPIFEIIGGGTRNRIKVYNTLGVYGEIDEAHKVWSDPVEVARNLLDQGITGMKMSPTDFIARESDGQLLFQDDLDWALRPIREIREKLGMEIDIANDGHAKWNLPNAIRIVREMEPLRPMWHEELISPLNEEAHRRLQAVTSTPIAAAERLMTRYQHRRFIESPSARISMPDLTWTGGISEVKKIAVLASAHQKPIAPHDCVGPVNMIACAHIAMATPNVMIMEYNRAMHLGWYRDFIEPDFVIDGGFLNAPTEPGLGTRLKASVKTRSDATVRTSSERSESWLMSDERYTYPPKNIQGEFIQSTERRRTGFDASYYD